MYPVFQYIPYKEHYILLPTSLSSVTVSQKKIILNFSAHFLFFSFCHKRQVTFILVESKPWNDQTPDKAVKMNGEFVLCHFSLWKLLSLSLFLAVALPFSLSFSLSLPPSFSPSPSLFSLPLPRFSFWLCVALFLTLYISIFKAGPLGLSFWSFLHHGVEGVERHLLWKFHKKIQWKSWSNVPPKLLACIRFLYKVVHTIGRLRKFNRVREIALNFFTTWTMFMKLGTLVHHVHGNQMLPQMLQNLPTDLVMVFQIRKKRGKIITKL